MLNIQPNGNSTFAMSKNMRYSNHVSFGGEADDMNDDNDSLENLKQTKRTFETLSRDENSPSAVGKIAKFGAILGTGLIGGISMKYGLETTFKLFSKMSENKAVKPIINGLKDAGAEIKKSLGKLEASVKNTEKYQKISKKFNESKLGKKVIDLYGKFQKTDFYASVKNGVKNIKSKVKEWFITLSAGVTAVCSGAEAAGFVKHNDGVNKTSKEEDYN